MVSFPRPRRPPILAAMARSGVRRILALAGFPLLLAAMATPVVIWRHELWQLFSSDTGLREWVAGFGGWKAKLVFIALQALQVVVFVIPGEIPQVAGGYLFGPWLGTVLSVCGILIGSTIVFFLARLLGTPFVRALFPPDQVDRIGKLLGTRGARISFFLLFLIPGIPKDILCYVAGVSPMGFPFFAGASMLGRLPGIVLSAIFGNAAAGRRWVLVIGLGAAAVALFVAGWLLREPLQRWIERVARRKRPRPSRRRRTAARTPRPGRGRPSSARPGTQARRSRPTGGARRPS
jgi:uncharacterized membrane protein YdjX (TVP38/TMEM64 family)